MERFWFLCFAIPSVGGLYDDVFLVPGQWFLTNAATAEEADTRYRHAAGYGPEVEVGVVLVEQVLP